MIKLLSKEQYEGSEDQNRDNPIIGYSKVEGDSDYYKRVYMDIRHYFKPENKNGTLCCCGKHIHDGVHYRLSDH